MRHFQSAIQEDRRRRVTKTGRDIEILIAAGQMREAWSKIQQGYQQAKGHPKPLTREGLDHTSTLREDLYRQTPPEGKAIPILVQP